MPTTPTLSYVLSEQKRLAQLALADKDNQRLILMAVAAGTVSSIALARLYSKLTEDKSDDDLRSLASTGLLAVGAGVLSVMWKLNKAQFRLPSVEPAVSAITDMASSVTEDVNAFLYDP